ncbi:unnamed protein product, partial [marine sediment metagenome]
RYLIRHLRAPTPERGMISYGEIPKESMISIMMEHPETITKSAEEAAREAVSKMGNKKVRAAIIFDCVSRASVLKERANEEVEVIRKVLGKDVPVFGFYAYGEIGAPEGGKPELNNKTVIVYTIGE